MKKKNNKNKNKSEAPLAKTTNEDSIDVSTANAENRFTWEEVRKGITDQGGNASADVRMKDGKKDDHEQKTSSTPSKTKKK